MTITIREQQDWAENDGTAFPTFTLGAGTQVGDTILFIQANDWYTLAGIQTPTGTAVTTWTLVNSYDGGTNADHVKIWVGTVTTGGASTVIPNTNTAKDEERYAGLVVFAGDVDYDDSGFTLSSSASTSHIAPSVNAAGTDDQLICVFYDRTNAANYSNFGNLTAYTERDITGFRTWRMGSEQLSASGATGTRTWTCSQSHQYLTYSVTIKNVSAPAEEAPAGNAAVTATANNPANDIEPSAGAGAVTATANNPAGNVKPSAGAGAVTATANNAGGGIKPSAGAGAVTVAAFNPTVETHGSTNAQAEAASVAATANNPAGDVKPSAGAASVTVTANDATVATGRFAYAGCATVWLISQRPGEAAAESAAVTATAFDATVETVEGGQDKSDDDLSPQLAESVGLVVDVTGSDTTPQLVESVTDLVVNVTDSDTSPQLVESYTDREATDSDSSPQVVEDAQVDGGSDKNSNDTSPQVVEDATLVVDVTSGDTSPQLVEDGSLVVDVTSSDTSPQLVESVTDLVVDVTSSDTSPQLVESVTDLVVEVPDSDTSPGLVESVTAHELTASDTSPQVVEDAQVDGGSDKNSNDTSPLVVESVTDLIVNVTDSDTSPQLTESTAPVDLASDDTSPQLVESVTALVVAVTDSDTATATEDATVLGGADKTDTDTSPQVVEAVAARTLTGGDTAAQPTESIGLVVEVTDSDTSPQLAESVTARDLASSDTGTLAEEATVEGGDYKMSSDARPAIDETEALVVYVSDADLAAVVEAANQIAELAASDLVSVTESHSFGVGTFEGGGSVATTVECGPGMVSQPEGGAWVASNGVESDR